MNEEVCRASFDDIDIIVRQDGLRVSTSQRPLSDFRLVLVRISGRSSDFFDILNILEVYCNEHNVKLINSYGINHTISKLSQAVLMYRAKIPFPKTVYLNKVGAVNLQDKINFPCIIKDVSGSHGDNNFLVNSAEEARKLILENNNIRFIAQDFIENDGDFRVLSCGNEELVIHRRSAAGAHLNNTSQGGNSEIVDDLSEIIIKDCAKVMNVMGKQLAGIDVIIDSKTGKHFFLEVNFQPQIMTGAFTEEKQSFFLRALSNL